MGTSVRSRDPLRSERFLGDLSAALSQARRVLHGEEYAHGLVSHWFSDNVCLSAPGDGALSLSTVAQSAGMLAATFARRGVFLRGAITVDLHYQQGSVAYGPGLTDAAEAESRTVFFPRIALLPQARQTAEPHADGHVAPLAEDTADGEVFVDFIQYLGDDLATVAKGIVAAVGQAETITDDVQRERAERQAKWLVDYFHDSTGRSPHSPHRDTRPPGRFVPLTHLPQTPSLETQWGPTPKMDRPSPRR